MNLSGERKGREGDAAVAPIVLVIYTLLLATVNSHDAKQ